MDTGKTHYNASQKFLENKNKKSASNKFGTSNNYFQYMDDFTNGSLEKPKHANKAVSQVIQNGK